MKRLPIVGVMGSGSESYSDQAARLGRWLAKQDVHLLTGGGGGVRCCQPSLLRGSDSQRPRAENGGAKLDHRAANRSCFWAE